MSAGPLDGIVVLDLTRTLAGAHATLLLADYGAQVIRIAPSQGDHTLTAHYAWPFWGRGKETRRLDLGSREGHQRLLTWLHGADVLIEDFTTQERKALGLEEERLRPAYPGLVTCAIAGYGFQGPEAERPAVEGLVAARTGIHDAQPGFRPGPSYMRIPFCNLGAGFLAAQGVCAALYARERTGKGERVETSLFQGSEAFNTLAFIQIPDTKPWARSSRATGDQPLYSLHRCADGRWIHFGIALPKFWILFAQLTGMEDALTDERYMEVPRNYGSDEEREELYRRVDEVLATRSSEEWLELFAQNDIPAGLAAWPDEVMASPQAAANGMVAEIRDPKAGKVRMVGLPLKLYGTPGEVRPRTLANGPGPDPPRKPMPKGKGATLRHPLEGIRILDLSAYLAGPYAPMLLGDLGAEVIKVEALDGDPLGHSLATRLGVNRNKRGVSLDLKRPEALEAVYKLAEKADIVLQNMRPGVAERLGIGYEQMRKLNPKVIYLQSTAYGHTGPEAHKPGMDPVAQARSGIETTQGGLTNPPVFHRIPVCDLTNAILLALGALMALYHRERTGQGQVIETCLLTAGMWMNGEALLHREDGPTYAKQDPGQYGPGPLERLYETAEGWLFIACPEDDSFVRLCTAMGQAGLATEPRFSTRAAREKNAEALATALQEALRTKTATGWMGIFQPLNLPVERVREDYALHIFSDPHVSENGLSCTLDQPPFGNVQHMGALWRFSAMSPRLARLGPALGQHTYEVLDDLGYPQEQVAQWEERQIARAFKRDG